MHLSVRNLLRFLVVIGVQLIYKCYNEVVNGCPTTIDEWKQKAESQANIKLNMMRTSSFGVSSKPWTAFYCYQIVYRFPTPTPLIPSLEKKKKKEQGWKHRMYWRRLSNSQEFLFQVPFTSQVDHRCFRMSIVKLGDKGEI